MNRFAELSCPVCRVPLHQDGKRLVCQSGHSFDIAREGYVNLLRPSGPASRAAGDDPAMIDARRRFLERGHYAQLDQALVEAVKAAVSASFNERRQPQVVVDAGCGDGWHTAQIQTALGSAASRVYGLDLSKAAARRCARSFPELAVVVSNLKRRLPFADASVDVLISVFAPRNPPEFLRLLRPPGRLIVVVPGPSHLSALRAHVPMLPISTDKVGQVGASLLPLERLDTCEVRFDMKLSPREAGTLLDMTPNFWAVPETAKLALSAMDHDLTINAEFIIMTFAGEEPVRAAHVPEVIVS